MDWLVPILWTFIAAGCAGWYFRGCLWLERERAEIKAMRAMVELNLRRSERLFMQLEAFPGDDDDPSPPLPH